MVSIFNLQIFWLECEKVWLSRNDKVLFMSKTTVSLIFAFILGIKGAAIRIWRAELALALDELLNEPRVCVA